MHFPVHREMIPEQYVGHILFDRIRVTMGLHFLIEKKNESQVNKISVITYMAQKKNDTIVLMSEIIF